MQGRIESLEDYRGKLGCKEAEHVSLSHILCREQGWAASIKKKPLTIITNTKL